jgi:hypothetical protein
MDDGTPQDDDYATPIADDLIMMRMKKELVMLPDDHIQLLTIWKEGLPKRQNNFEYAKKRLFLLLGSKLMTNGTLLKDYNDVFLKWETSGYIERVQDENPLRPSVWYWAHFPIVKEEKETTKSRPVLDGAAKFRGIYLH